MHKLLFIHCVVALILVGCGRTDEKFIYERDNVAMGGYDLVAYVMDNDALPGNEAFSTEYQGVTFYFTRSSYKDEFLRSPEKYLPAFGGFCGYEMAKNGERVGSEPTVWIVQDGRLIFFSDNDELEGKHKAEWVVNRKEFMKRATENWIEMQ
jgi:YHS domain-containing protein